MKLNIALAALSASMLIAGAAHATVVNYSSSGSFSGLSFNPGNGNASTSCAQGNPPCSISSSGGTNNFLDMSGNNNSTLVANTVSGSVVVPPSAFGVTVGSLTWDNRPSTGTDDSFQVSFTFALGFNGSNDTQLFTLLITQPSNPPGDNVLNLSNATLSGLGPYSVAGVSISNIHFALGAVTSIGSNATHNSTYNGTNWNLDENTRATINILADIKATATPEPASMAVLGTALVGLGMIRRRTRQG